jgi:hypothetical protein
MTMAEAHFGKDGIDRETFAPVQLIDQRRSQWKDVRLSFDAWDWLQEVIGGDEGHSSLNDYYLNGHGVQGLVMACRLHAGLDPEAEGILYNSEGDTCFIHFSKLDDAVQTAHLASDMLRDRRKLVAMIEVAREHGFED